MTNIFPSKSEYNHIILQVNLYAFSRLISLQAYEINQKSSRDLLVDRDQRVE
jgi:hypothetical protein